MPAEARQPLGLQAAARGKACSPQFRHAVRERTDDHVWCLSRERGLLTLSGLVHGLVVFPKAIISPMCMRLRRRYRQRQEGE